jgi:hypothetical protein
LKKKIENKLSIYDFSQREIRGVVLKALRRAFEDHGLEEVKGLKGFWVGLKVSGQIE